MVSSGTRSTAGLQRNLPPRRRWSHRVRRSGESARASEWPPLSVGHSDPYKLMIWMLIATRMAMLNATMNKKNFPTAVPSNEPQRGDCEMVRSAGELCSGPKKKARHRGGPSCARVQIATP